MTAPINLLDLTPGDAAIVLREAMDALGQPAYRASQVVRRLWVNPAPDFEAMTELPAALRTALAERFVLPRLALAVRQASTDGTQKFLFTLADGQSIETVAIPDGDRMTFCISSQAGCALACAFCATGVMGFQRNLAVHEIAGQVRELAMLTPPIRATNIVFMGMGEPLMNWRAVSPTLTILNAPDGLGIGARHITVSTVGVLPGIVALGERPEQFRLAISIHAPNDELRQELMPVNTKFPLAEVIEAAAAFDRRVTFEYVMLGGRERPARARRATRIARTRVPRLREPDPAAPRRRARFRPHAARQHPAVRELDSRRGRRSRHPAQSRPRHQCGVWPAARGKDRAPPRGHRELTRCGPARTAPANCAQGWKASPGGR